MEVKGPKSSRHWWPLYHYDYDKACLDVIELIEKYDIGSRVMLSSFNFEIYEALLRMSRPPRKRDFII